MYGNAIPSAGILTVTCCRALGIPPASYKYKEHNQKILIFLLFYMGINFGTGC
jgi:hypothetical protein